MARRWDFPPLARTHELVYHVLPLGVAPGRGRPSFQIRASALASVDATHPNTLPSFEAAHEAARREVVKRLARAREQVAGLERELGELEDFYANPELPAATLDRHREAILEALRAYRDTGKAVSRFFPALRIHCGHLSQRNAIVFSLDDQVNVFHPFTAADVLTVFGLMEEAGLVIADAWSVEHSGHIHVRVRSPERTDG